MHLSHTIAVIGGGFYGCSVAEYLARQGSKVVLFEQTDDILTRASYSNQARLHQGYHYPRSFSTAYRSRLNFARFFQDYRPAIVTEFVKLYAIAQIGSKVSPRQFEHFCSTIGAPLRIARPQFTELFCSRLIAAVYETQEYAFDAGILRQLLRERLEQARVAIQFNTLIRAIESDRTSDRLRVFDSEGNCTVADYVFNCTYSGLNQVQGIGSSRLKLKHEITELALVELPAELKEISVTVMDGPYFSFMPFPDRRLSTFSHVRYTPHTAWMETEITKNPYAVLSEVEKTSNFGYMIRDAQRYMPCLQQTTYRDSLFEVKTVLVRNEGDDGRPILFERNVSNPRIVSMLGSKIDNIYDALLATSTLFKQADSLLPASD